MFNDFWWFYIQTKLSFYFFKAGAAETGADALAAALGSDTCDMTGMDDKVKP